MQLAEAAAQSSAANRDGNDATGCCGSRVRVPRLLIDPRTSKLMGRLDLASLLALSFTALVTPMEVAFLPPPTTATDTLFIANRIVDVVFAVDIVAQFCIMYRDDTETTESRWVTSHRKIAWRYLRSWFLIDAVSTGLSALDFVELGRRAEEATGEGCTAASSSLSQFKALRVIRALRLIKLARLVRASRLIRRWETRLSINYAMLALLRLVLLVLLYLHWSACLWAASTLFESEGSLARTWLAIQEYCVVSGSEARGVLYPEPPPAGIAACDEAWRCRRASEVYVGALYTVSSVSAVIASPGNTREQVLAVVLMLAGGTVWAQVRWPCDDPLVGR